MSASLPAGAPAARKVDPEQARSGFRFGLYRHHKGGLYLATGLVEDEETDRARVIYRSIAYGKDYSRLLADPNEDAWSDHVLWPAPPVEPLPGKRKWPYGGWAPRFTLVPPFRFLMLVDGPPNEGAGEALQLAQALDTVEASPIYASARKTIAVLKSVLAKAPVVPVWISNVDHEPPPEHVRLLNGSRELILGQLLGILACVDPNVIVETAGPPIVESPDAG